MQHQNFAKYCSPTFTMSNLAKLPGYTCAQVESVKSGHCRLLQNFLASRRWKVWQEIFIHTHTRFNDAGKASSAANRKSPTTTRIGALVLCTCGKVCRRGGKFGCGRHISSGKKNSVSASQRPVCTLPSLQVVHRVVAQRSHKHLRSLAKTPGLVDGKSEKFGQGSQRADIFTSPAICHQTHIQLWHSTLVTLAKFLASCSGRATSSGLPCIPLDPDAASTLPPTPSQALPVLAKSAGSKVQVASSFAKRRLSPRQI